MSTLICIPWNCCVIFVFKNALRDTDVLAIDLKAYNRPNRSTVSPTQTAGGGLTRITD